MQRCLLVGHWKVTRKKLSHWFYLLRNSLSCSCSCTDPIIMDDRCPQKRKSHNQMDDSSKQGPYWEFEEESAHARKALISLYAEKAISHTDANGGSCRWGFVKNLFDAAARVASVLQITRLDINNEVRRITFCCRSEESTKLQLQLISNESIIKKIILIGPTLLLPNAELSSNRLGGSPVGVHWWNLYQCCRDKRIHFLPGPIVEKWF